LGEHWLAKYAPHYTSAQKREFLLGTVFPDIRYLGGVKKAQTHFQGVTLKKIQQAPTPFEQGMLLHSFVDDYRNTIVKKNSIYKKAKEVPSKLQQTFLKLVEDQLLYDQLSSREFFTFFSTIPEGEKKFNISPETLLQWHTGLTLYFTLSPQRMLSQISFIEKNVPVIDRATVEQWSMLLPRYTQDKAMQAHAKSMVAAFDKVFNENHR
jgi:hypothetical protein